MPEINLSDLDKKLDKLLTLNVKIAKALHLLPVTEKEERAIQVQQRKNLEIASKINYELNALENKSNESEDSVLSINNLDTSEGVYDDVIGDDFLGGR